MNKKERQLKGLIKLAMTSSSKTRTAYLSNHLLRFGMFYFPEYFTFDTPDYLKVFCKALDSGKNVFFKWFRWCSKTTWTQAYAIQCISNKKRRNIMWYAQNVADAEENLTYVANALIGGDNTTPNRLVKDYWQLYYDNNSSRFSEKKSKRTNKFVTENEVFVRAMSLWTSPRGKNYTASDWKYRPDLLIFDDVDTLSSVNSTKKIDKHFTFLLNEVLWGTTSACQLIFLGNTIYDDWLVPRFEEHIKDNPDWIILNQAIYDDKWEIVWNRFVQSEAEMLALNKNITQSNLKYTSLDVEKRTLWAISFNQNYLNIPYTRGTRIITRDMIKLENCSDYGFDFIKMGIDPAVSEKTWSDAFWITICWYDWDRKYILESVGLTEGEKNIKKAVATIEYLYNKRKVNLIWVETVAYQAILKTILQDRNLAVQWEVTNKDKVSRLLEHQAEIEDWKVIFNTTGTQDLIDELLLFPSWEHDDMVDSFVYSITRKKSGFFISSV